MFKVGDGVVMRHFFTDGNVNCPQKPINPYSLWIKEATPLKIISIANDSCVVVSEDGPSEEYNKVYFTEIVLRNPYINTRLLSGGNV